VSPSRLRRLGPLLGLVAILALAVGLTPAAALRPAPEGAASSDFPFAGADTMALHNGSHRYITYGASAHGRKVPFTISGHGDHVATRGVISGDAKPTFSSKVWLDPSHGIWTPSPFYAKRGGIGRYYLFFTATEKGTARPGTNGHKCIGVMRSRKPTGGFAVQPGALICPGGGRWAIDANVSRGPGRAIWITWRDDSASTPGDNAFSAALVSFHDDGSVSVGRKTVLLQGKGIRWAHYGRPDSHIVENPAAFYGNGGWYLFFSGNTWHSKYYATGIAYCGAKLGDGGCTPIPGPNKAWFAYTKAYPRNMWLRGLPGNHPGPGAMDVYRARDGKPWVTWNYLHTGGRRSTVGRLIMRGKGAQATFAVRRG
jgi:hypothetical protein